MSTSQTPDIRRVLVVGAGTMGQQIALQCATHGLDVTLHDVDERALTAARQSIDALIARLRAADPAVAEHLAAGATRLAYTADAAQAAARADLVSESVPEDPELKGRVFAALHRLCPEHTLFTTNTSSLVPSMFAAATGRPDRFAALHFHQPVWSATVVDVMPHPGTSEATMDSLVGFAHRIGQTPIRLAKESPGYVFNAMYNALNREAITLAANGVASVEDVDRAWTTVTKMPLGPFGMLDIVGLDTAFHITAYWARATGDPQVITNAAWLKGFVDAGRLGTKAGRGFYDYPDSAG